MKVTLTHDGKSVELDLTAEQMTALGLKEGKKKTGYERVGEGEKYYPLAHDGSILTFRDMSINSAHQDNYWAANYHSDHDLARSNARADKLMRQLRRFAAENGGIPSVEDWKEKSIPKFRLHHSISYDYDAKQLIAASWGLIRCAGGVYFNSEEACEKAIEKFHDELLWYFTEYEAMLR
jgi:hypothetical protein